MPLVDELDARGRQKARPILILIGALGLPAFHRPSHRCVHGAGFALALGKPALWVQHFEARSYGVDRPVTVVEDARR